MNVKPSQHMRRTNELSRSARVGTVQSLALLTEAIPPAAEKHSALCW